MDNSTSPIILFDGVCNLCNASVQFVIERDPKAIFHFAALQSDFGQAIVAKNAINTEGGESVILVENGNIYDRSTAALRIANRMQYGFHVRGPSQWHKGHAGWRLTAPAPVQTVPITYA